MFNKSHDKKYIFDKLESFHQMDMTYDSGRILGSMCTKPHPIALEAYKMFIETNLGDGGLFKGTSMMEEEVISSLSKLLHADEACGHIVTGGTEANIMAMCAAKYIFQEKSDETPEVILPRTAHFSFKKACSMLSLKTVEVPLNENYKIDTTMLEDCITDNTMAITAIAGSTEFGLVDDIKEISKIAKSNGVYLHVDAALGGFIIPFLNYRNDNQLNFDFKCKGVSSITIDPHKMGLAPVPAGGILFRHKKYLDKLAIDAPYLTKNVQTTIVGTRTGASTAATWALINYHGFIIPFLNYRNDNQLNFDFKCKGVSSITIDPHKMGLAPVPAGGILFRHKKYLDKLAIDAPYLTKNVQTTIVGTRTGASTAATWALINYHGMEGYADVVEQSINLTQYTYNKLMQMDDVNVIVKPELNVVAFNVSDMKVNKLKEELLKKGWRVSNTVNPYAIRLVLMPHVKKEHIDNFLVDLREIIKEN